jgi:hypothetical protein
MSHHPTKSDDPKIQAHIERLERRDRRIEHVLRRCLHLLEQAISGIIILVLMIALGFELSHIFTEPAYFEDVPNFLHNILTIVIGLEFVKLLMHLTPGNILEVLTMALSRGIIVNHANAVDNLLSIACIIGLFAAKRFLIPRAELNKEMDETAPEPHHHRGHRKHKHKQDEDHPEENKQEVH